MAYRVDQNEESPVILASGQDETAPEICQGCLADCDTCGLVE